MAKPKRLWNAGRAGRVHPRASGRVRRVSGGARPTAVVAKLDLHGVPKAAPERGVIQFLSGGGGDAVPGREGGAGGEVCRTLAQWRAAGEVSHRGGSQPIRQGVQGVAGEGPGQEGNAAGTVSLRRA